jgi:hypothetical protein
VDVVFFDGIIAILSDRLDGNCALLKNRPKNLSETSFAQSRPKLDVLNVKNEKSGRKIRKQSNIIKLTRETKQRKS